LTAFIPFDRHTRAGFLTLNTPTSSFTFSGTRTTRDALLGSGCAGIIVQFIQSHNASPLPDVTPEA
jgi:hypothetical protein